MFSTFILSIAISKGTKIISYQRLPAGLPNAFDFQLLTREPYIHNHFVVFKALQGLQTYGHSYEDYYCILYLTMFANILLARGSALTGRSARQTSARLRFPLALLFVFDKPFTI